MMDAVVDDTGELDRDRDGRIPEESAQLKIWMNGDLDEVV